MLEIPERLIKAILFVRGQEEGAAWLQRLPQRVNLYLRRWELTPIEVAEGGAMSCCLFCVTASGQEAVLKIPFDAASGRLESRSLQRWSVSGSCPAVLAAAPSSGVYLMTRVRPGVTAHPSGDPSDSQRFCELMTRMSRPGLGNLGRLKRIGEVTRTRFQWAYDRFLDRGYELQQTQMAGVEQLLSALEASSRHDSIIHADLQAKNILVGPNGVWQAIDPFTCRGELNAEAALWAVVQKDGSTIDQRITELVTSELLDYNRLRAWCYIFSVAEYRSYEADVAVRARAFTSGLHWRQLAGALHSPAASRLQE